MEEKREFIFKRSLPNAAPILVLGIMSIVTCWCYGIVGIVLSIIALVLYNDAHVLYRRTPQEFTEGSFSNAKAGKVCAIIGLVLSSIFLIIIILTYALGLMAIAGFDTFIDKWIQ